MSSDFRPQPIWIPAGLLVGLAGGAVVGGVVMTAASFAPDGDPSTTSLTGGAAGDMLSFGLAAGAMWGAATGLIVGFVLMCAVGRHLPLTSAVDTARWTGMVTTFFVLGTALLPLWDSQAIAVSILVLGVLLAGATCAWVARWGRTEADVS